MRAEPLPELVERARIAARRIRAGEDELGVRLAEEDAEPRRQADPVVRFLRSQHREVLVPPYQPLEPAPRLRVLGRELLGEARPGGLCARAARGEEREGGEAEGEGELLHRRVPGL